MNDPITIVTVPVMPDNYAYLLTAGSQAVVIDPGAEAPVEKALRECACQPVLILLTHRHADHMAGALPLVVRYQCRYIQAGRDLNVNADPISFGDVVIIPLHTPGHTRDSVCYYVPAVDAVFTGDTLFGGGCGRLCGGTVMEMWSSLNRLRRLPPATNVYPGHDYTIENLEFAVDFDPENIFVAQRLAEERRKSRAGVCLAPSSMAEERLTNPFLRADHPAVARRAGESAARPERVFAVLRERKDHW